MNPSPSRPAAALAAVLLAQGFLAGCASATSGAATSASARPSTTARASTPAIRRPALSTSPEPPPRRLTRRGPYAPCASSSWIKPAADYGGKSPRSLALADESPQRHHQPHGKRPRIIAGG